MSRSAIDLSSSSVKVVISESCFLYRASSSLLVVSACSITASTFFSYSIIWFIASSSRSTKLIGSLVGVLLLVVGSAGVGVSVGNDGGTTGLGGVALGGLGGNDGGVPGVGGVAAEGKRNGGAGFVESIFVELKITEDSKANLKNIFHPEAWRSR